MTAVAFHWSGGKDSALALCRLLSGGRHRVERLVTTVHPARAESSVHGVPCELLSAQASAIGIPIDFVELPGAGLDGYEQVIADSTRALLEDGIDALAFGDLDASGLIELKRAQFNALGIDVVEPLSGLSSRECIEAFLDAGITATTVVVDASVLAAGHLGRRIDRDFVSSLPAGCDPCGELGEFHTFVSDAPCFSAAVEFTTGAVETIERRIGTTAGVREFRYLRLPLQTPGGRPPL